MPVLLPDRALFLFPAMKASPVAAENGADNGSPKPAKEIDLKDAAAKAEYDTIMNVLKDVNFNKTKAAEILKIDRKTLYNKIKIYQSL